MWISADGKTCCIDHLANHEEKEEAKNELIKVLQDVELDHVMARNKAYEQLDEDPELASREAELDLLYTDRVLHAVRSYFDKRSEIRRRYFRKLP